MPELADYVDPESVRKLCRADITASELPDAVILLKVYVRPAVAELLQLDPGAATRQNDDLAHVESALNRLVAAQVIQAVPMLTREDFGDDGGYQVQQINPEKRAAALRTEAAAVMGVVVGVARPYEPAAPPPFIVVE